MKSNVCRVYTSKCGRKLACNTQIANNPKIRPGVMITAASSTINYSMILNGSEIIIGDSIIIPMAISTLATTISMIRNGMDRMKPIWNAVFSSLVTNAGSSTQNVTSSGLANCSSAIRMNRPRSLSRVCASMNFLNGSDAASTASREVISSCK